MITKEKHLRKLGTGHSDHLEPLMPLDLEKINSIDDLVRAMGHTAFAGRNVGEAADVLETMVRDESCFKVLTLSGAMTVAKMGLLVCDMIDNGMCDAIVSTGALMAHGFIESAGMEHFKYRPDMEDTELYKRGYNRVYDTLEPETNFNRAYEIFKSQILGWDLNEVACSYKINKKLGEYLHKNVNGRGLLKSAYDKNVPVYIPAFTDSELGLDLALIRRELRKKGKDMSYDPFLDLEDYTERVLKAKTLGIFTIGGGVPRNWAQQGGPYLDLIRWRLIDNGDYSKYHISEEEGNGHVKKFKYAVRICPEPTHFGGLCLHGDTKIDTPRDLSVFPEGIPIKDLVGKYNFPVYSYDTQKGRIVLSNVRQVWSTGKKKLYKLTYGWISGWVSGKREFKSDSIIASQDHKFMLRDGTYKKLSELKENDRLMPFNSYYKADKHGEYRFIRLNNSRTIAEHRFIMQELKQMVLASNYAVHHIDHNTLNNSIENLDIIDFAEHARYHRFAESDESREKRIQALKENCDPVLMQQMSRSYWDGLSEEGYKELCEKRKEYALSSNEERLRRSNIAKNYWDSLNEEERRVRLQNAHNATAKRWLSLSQEVRSAIVSNEKNGRWIKGISEATVKDALVKENGIITKAARRLDITVKVFNKRMKIYGINRGWINNNCPDNHFVMFIEYYGEEDTYDMTVDDAHNFAANGIIVSNSGCTYSEGVSWGKFVPISEGGRQVEVYSDATIAWPMIVKAVLERLGKEK